MFTLETGSGFWNPVIWIGVICVAFLFTYILKGLGKKSYKIGTQQTKAFLSGNPELEKEKMHIKGKNMYWGFTESLKGYYQYLLRLHTGNVSDYVLWFVIVMAILFIIVGVI